MKRMLFNATQAEELRVAIVDGQKLIDLDIESANKEQRKSNIYKGVITRVEPSLEAAFVNYGEDRHGFLPFKEISRSYFLPGYEGRPRIQDVIKEGQELIVQVEKDERGNKGAALTTYVSLAGRYLVLMPNNPRGGGVSRRVEGDERAELREIMDQIQMPEGMSIIARTAAIGRNLEELQWDLNYLLQLWSAIEGASTQQKGPFLIYLESSLVIRAIRDYFQPDIGEILIDTSDVFEQAQAFMGTVMPANVNRVKFYRDDVPLFSRFQIEHQIESAYSRQVNLPSGGAIVIDHTEALVAVDVNSGRATRGQDIEETALKTNLEAADELARQLRLRDLGGLIVIDFIDMESQKNQREVEIRLRDGLRYDRARVQMGKISRFGLMELSRQRLRPALAETSYIPCPRCTGTGHIRSTESAALHILRILEEESMKDNTGAVHIQVPVDVATFLLNEKRADVQAIEQRHKISILLIPNIHLETPAHTITRLRHDDLNHDEGKEPSYKMVDVPSDEIKGTTATNDQVRPRQEAAIKQISPEKPAPVVQEKPAQTHEQPQGFIAKILSWFRAPEQEVAPVQDEKPRETSRRNPRREGRKGDSRGDIREGRASESGRDVPREPKNSREAPPLSSNRETGEPRDERRRGRNERSERSDRNDKQQERGEKEPKRETAKEGGSRNEAAPLDQPPSRRERRERPQRQSTANGTAETPLVAGETDEPRRRGRRNRRETAAPDVPTSSIMLSGADIPPAALELVIPEQTGTVSSTDWQGKPEVSKIPEQEAAAVEPSQSHHEKEKPQSTVGLHEGSTAEKQESRQVEAEVNLPSKDTQPLERAAPAEKVLPEPSPVATSSEPLESLLADSDLVLVQTDTSKHLPPPVQEKVITPKPRRRRPAPVSPQQDEPLVMVETQGKT